MRVLREEATKLGTTGPQLLCDFMLASQWRWKIAASE